MVVKDSRFRMINAPWIEIQDKFNWSEADILKVGRSYLKPIFRITSSKDFVVKDLGNIDQGEVSWWKCEKKKER
jgi:hypothetical protein